MKLKIDSLAFDALAPASAPRQAAFDHFAGIAKLREEPYGMSGCLLAANIVLVRTYTAGTFSIAVRIGSHWHELAEIPRDDPGIRQLADAGQLVEYGESPTQREKRERQEAEERERARAAEAAVRERAQLRIGIRDRREQKRREAIRARM